MPETAPLLGCEIATVGGVVSTELGLPPAGALAPPPPPPPHPAKTIANAVASERMRSIKRFSLFEAAVQYQPMGGESVVARSLSSECLICSDVERRRRGPHTYITRSVM